MTQISRYVVPGACTVLLVATISARAAVPPLAAVPDRQLDSHSASVLGNELLRRNGDTRDILRFRELTSKYLSGGSDRDFAPQLQVAVTAAPDLLGPGVACRSLRLRYDPAYPTNYLPALVIDGPWCLTQAGWQAMTLRVSGAFPKPESELPRPWDNHGLETTLLVVTPGLGG